MGHMNYPSPQGYSEPEFPKIVTLCGSTRFRDDFDAAMAAMTLEGHIVIGPGVWVHQSASFADLPPAEAEAVKAKLDDLHKRKIDLADGVYVVNPSGYIGDSTRSEIVYALRTGTPVTYLVPVDESGDAA